MSKWNSSEWAELYSGASCPICKAGKPNGILLDLSAVSHLTSYSEAPVYGYCCLVFKRHVVELDELSEDEAVTLMKDIRRVTAALRDVTGFAKLNYEIHGNTIPHLHVHFYPRYRDPFADDAIDTPPANSSPYRSSEYAEFCQRLCIRLTNS